MKRRGEPLEGTCEGCGLEVTERTEDNECPDCGAEIIWPEIPAHGVRLEADIPTHERKSVAEELSKLAALYDKGLLTKNEFAAAKRRVPRRQAD